MQRLQTPAISFHHIAIAHRDVRREGEISPRLAGIAPRTMRAEGIHRGASCRLEWRRPRRMIDMSVRNKDMGNRFASQRGLQRIDMRAQKRPGIDDRHLALADDIGSGTHEGERPRIIGHDPADQRRDGYKPAIGAGEVAVIQHASASILKSRHI